MASAPDAQQVQALSSKVKKLLVKELQAVLKAERVPSGGLKQQQQTRLLQHVHEIATKPHRYLEWARLRENIHHPERTTFAPHYRQTQSTSSLPSPYPPYGPSNPLSNALPTRIERLEFRPSPFFTVEEPLVPVELCPGKVGHHMRHSIITRVRLKPETAEKLRNDSSYRVMLFCAADDSLRQYTRLEVSFPKEVELKINHDMVKANFRGLKNKPGSTRPVDITGHLRKVENYENTVSFAYNLTDKKFTLVINLVKLHPVEELVQTLRSGRSITKEKVIQEMRSRADDADIVATSTVMSLKCPVSMGRIQLACRSTVCSHNQCFDAESFLLMQEQGPTWTCPVCAKIISYEALVVDQYVNEILSSTSKSVEQVTIEPDGTWSDKSKASNTPVPRNIKRAITEDDDDDDDLVVIESLSGKGVKSSTNGGISLVNGGGSSSDRAGSQPSARASTNKRPIGDVIDLTSDDEGPPASKRPVYLGTPIGGSGESVGGMGIGSASAATSLIELCPPITPYNAVNGNPRPAQTL